MFDRLNELFDEVLFPFAALAGGFLLIILGLGGIQRGTAPVTVAGALLIFLHFYIRANVKRIRGSENDESG